MARQYKRGRRLADVFSAFVFILLVAFAAAYFEHLNTDTLGGKFAAGDGDSLTHESGRLRLVGIDAPEYAQICRRGSADWACGQAARTHLQQLISGGSGVACKGSARDKYDRLLVECFATGKSINRQMVADGYAVAYGDFEKEESVARAQRLGIWASDFEVPSQWRAARRGSLIETEHNRQLRAMMQRLLAPIFMIVDRVWR